MTDREMLERCLRAIEEAMYAGEHGIPTNWEAFIVSLRKHLS